MEETFTKILKKIVCESVQWMLLVEDTIQVLYKAKNFYTK
jgi:hypothetical protein